MSPITSWLRAFFALQTRAMEARGYIEINPGTDDAARWPRTTGADVIAIAAVIDPYVRSEPLRFGGHGLAARWRVCMDDLERLALSAPHETYAENRSFWRTLPAVCVYLHSVSAPIMEPSRFDALLRQLDAPDSLRNIGPRGDGPFQHFDGVRTFDDLYLAQWKHLLALRGFDVRAPEPGMGGGTTSIPRTTNADVIALADYWSKQLGDVKRVMGHDGVVKRWKTALGDVGELARKGEPTTVYSKNNGFWRDMRATAVHIAAADEAPTTADMVIDSVMDSLKSLPQNIEAGVKAVGKGAVDLAGGIAHGAGQIAHEAGKGLFSGAGVPLLVGAGLVGLFLLSRGRGGDAE
jgi:hypothetical protein